MGFGIKELLIVLVIVLLLFGTKKLKSMGSDLGGAIKGFRKSVQDTDETEADDTAGLTQQRDESDNSTTIDAEHKSTHRSRSS